MFADGSVHGAVLSTPLTYTLSTAVPPMLAAVVVLTKVDETFVFG
jgi:hypothetical protein